MKQSTTAHSRRLRQYWLWVTGPDYYATIDGSDRPDLAPGLGGEWTCSQDTAKGDLVLLYRTAPRSDIAYLLEVSSDAFVSEWKDEFAGAWACEFESRVRFANPLSLSTMRADGTLAEGFGPLRAQFRRRSYRLDDTWWDHLLSLLLSENPSAGPVVRRLQKTAVSRELLLESQIEDHLARRVAVLDPGKGLKLYSGLAPDGTKQSGRQYVCYGGTGRIDLLCRDQEGYVVVEIKRDRVDPRTMGQVLGYIGWVRSNLASRKERVRGIVVGRESDQQFQQALQAIPDVVSFVKLDTIATKLGLPS